MPRRLNTNNVLLLDDVAAATAIAYEVETKLRSLCALCTSLGWDAVAQYIQLATHELIALRTSKNEQPSMRAQNMNRRGS